MMEDNNGTLGKPATPFPQKHRKDPQIMVENARHQDIESHAWHSSLADLNPRTRQFIATISRRAKFSLKKTPPNLLFQNGLVFTLHTFCD
jgi:hypothetical protein